jgi:hypothetical protein
VKACLLRLVSSSSFVTRTLLSGLLLLAGVAGSIQPAMAQFSQKVPRFTAGFTPDPVALGRATLVEHVSPDQVLRLVIGLQPPHMDQEEQFIRDVQDPKSPLFHHYMTAEEWNSKFSPSTADEQALIDWVKSKGLTITHRFPNRLLVDAEGTVRTIEQAFNVTLNSYTLGDRSFFSNDRDASIPASLNNIILSVGGLNSYEVFEPIHRVGSQFHFPMYSPGPATSAGPSGHGDADRTKLPASLKWMLEKGKPSSARVSPAASRAKSNLIQPITNGSYDPTDLYSSYGYDTSALYHLGLCCNPLGNANVTPPETSIAVATVGYQLGSDITGFQSHYPYLAYHYQEFFIDGTPPNEDGEGTLDAEWATAMSNSFGSFVDTAMIYLYDGAANTASNWTDTFNHILTDGNARIMTNSHGCNESTCNNNATLSTQHNIFVSMVGQGWTLVSISYDKGATADCSTTSVSWPGSDPNILDAGGTTLVLNSSGVYVSETAWQGGTSAGSCNANDGGTGGGCSVVFSTPSYQNSLQACGADSRSVPDLSLNAGWGQNIYVGGGFGPVGGTSIVAPEMAGFFAQENAYLLYLGAVIGPNCHGGPCAPLGQPHYALYADAHAPFTYGHHYPFYDITSGCNSNDVTIAKNLTYYCAAQGYDLTTGFGSFNMLHLAWVFNTYVTGDFGAPTFIFQGPTVNKWYNSDQLVAWLATDTGTPATDVAGYTATWDADPFDIFIQPGPGCCNSYYSGPAVSGQRAGSSFVSTAGQGCHTMNVRAWDNTGLESDDGTYGPVCYDSVPPHTSDTLSGPTGGGVFTGAVKVSLSASDATSGVVSTSYQIDSGALQAYSAPFTVSATGSHAVNFFSTDKAGNQESTETAPFSIKGKTTAKISSSLSSAPFGQAIQFTATITAAYGGPATGGVTFKDGANAIGKGTLSGGKATFKTSTLSPGTHSITAVFSANANFLGSTSSAVSVNVTKAGSTTKIKSSVNPSSFHQSVTFTATVTSATSGIPAGSLTFRNGTTTLGSATLNANGVATFTTTALTVGSHSITGVYAGNADFKTSASTALTQTVKKAATTTTLTSSKNPSTHGTAVTFTATVKGAFGGTTAGIVTFKDGTAVLGTGSINATSHQATFTTSKLAVGTHNITASYGGNGSFTASASAIVKQKVN